MGKLTKRVIAIMCIFMMVISMVTVVEAVDTNGKVTVTNVKPGETYKIFKIKSSFAPCWFFKSKKHHFI